MATAELSVLDCGARGDGTTDDTAAFQQALRQAGRAGVGLFVPATAGGYRVSTLHLAGGNLYQWQVVRAARGALLRSTAPVCLSIDGSWVDVSGLSIDMSNEGGPPTSIGYYLNTQSQPLQNIRIRDTRCYHCGSGLADTPGQAHFVDLLTVEDFVCLIPKGVQIDLHSSKGYVTFRDVILDEYPGAAPGLPLARFQNFAGLRLDGFNVEGLGFNRDRYAPGNYAVVFQNGQTVWAQQFMVDQRVAGSCVRVEGVDYFSGLWCQCWGLGHGFVFAGCGYVSLTSPLLYGYRGELADAPPGANGLYLSGCKKAVVTGLRSKDWTAWGAVAVDGCQDVDFWGAHGENNGAGLVYAAPGCKNVCVDGVPL